MFSHVVTKCARKNIVPNKDKTLIVIKSPNEAAIGVATLSGFILYRRESNITAIIILLSTNEAMEVLVKLLAHNKAA